MNLASRLAMSIPALAGSWCLWFSAGCASGPEPAPVQGKKATVDFSTQIKPILHARCIMCHNRGTMPERTSFENGALALNGDKLGPVIVPGNAAGSRLIVAISSPDFHDKAMPPVSLRVRPGELDLFRRWIDEGAHWPAGAAGEIAPHSLPLE